MKIAAPDIERIVREVLRRIGADRAVAVGDQSAMASRINRSIGNQTGASATGREVVSGEELELTGNVISLSQVEGRLDGVSRVTAGFRSVVTPSVRDYLKQHGISLSLRTPDGNRHAQGVLWLATFAAPFDAQGLRDDLAQRGVVGRVLSGSSLPSISTQLARQLDGSATAVLLTSHCDVATCVVNRHRSIRGFVARDIESLATIQKATGGNLLITDPTELPGSDILEMACRMANQTPAVPVLWRGVL